MQKSGQVIASNKDLSKYGFVDIEGLKPQPYGTAYA